MIGVANNDAPTSTADLARAGERPAAAAPAPGEPVGQPAPTETLTQPGAAPLLPEGEVRDLRNRWDNIQAGFVDEPRRAVEDADALVASAMKRMAEVFASERSQLEGQWDRGDDVSTEDLRIALQRYRSFFGRILAV